MRTGSQMLMSSTPQVDMHLFLEVAQCHGGLANSGLITVSYIQTDKNLADPFTKGLSRNVIDSASREMGLRPVSVTP